MGTRDRRGTVQRLYFEWTAVCLVRIAFERHDVQSRDKPPTKVPPPTSSNGEPHYLGLGDTRQAWAKVKPDFCKLPKTRHQEGFVLFVETCAPLRGHRSPELELRGAILSRRENQNPRFCQQRVMNELVDPGVILIVERDGRRLFC